MSARKFVLGVMLAAVIMTIAPAAIHRHVDFVWNASASAPIGLYRVELEDHPAIPDLVVVMAPEPVAKILADGGYLPRGVPLLKRVLALPGQTVCRDHLAILIDGVVMAFARESDRRGRLLPVWQGCRAVGEGEVYLMNWQSADSLDGRYFGPIPASSILGRAIPLWTFEEP